MTNRIKIPAILPKLEWEIDREYKFRIPFSVNGMKELQVLTTRPNSDELISGGIGPETKQTMENISNVLEKYGSSMDKVVKCLCMLADISEWGDMSKAYVKFFPDHKPARSAFAGTGLALGARVEIECWATVN